MSNPMKFLPMILAQQWGAQELERIPENSSQVTENPDDAIQYDQVMKTALAVAYAVGLTIVHRVRNAPQQKATTALDLACGPGLYTLCLQTYLQYGQITGIDLSPAMLDIARKNAREKKLESQATFALGDVCDLKHVDDGTFDLASFTDAAHHMPDLETVGKVFSEMDRVTKPDGLVMAMDLVRLRTRALTEKYVRLLGADYIEMGLPYFYNQFRDSMYAAWTCRELEAAIPQNSRRVWCRLASKDLPTLQVILGLPVGRREPFLRKGYPWAPQDCPVPNNRRLDWFFARLTLLSAAVKYFPVRYAA